MQNHFRYLTLFLEYNYTTSYFHYIMILGTSNEKQIAKNLHSKIIKI